MAGCERDAKDARSLRRGYLAILGTKTVLLDVVGSVFCEVVCVVVNLGTCRAVCG